MMVICPVLGIIPKVCLLRSYKHDKKIERAMISTLTIVLELCGIVIDDLAGV